MLRTDTIEVKVGNVGVTDFILGTLPNIRTAKKVVSIEAYPADQVSHGPSGRAVVNSATFNQAFLILVSGAGNDLRTVPLRTIASSRENILQLDILPEGNSPAIDTEKSVIHVGNAGVLVAEQVFLLAITLRKVRRV